MELLAFLQEDGWTTELHHVVTRVFCVILFDYYYSVTHKHILHRHHYTGPWQDNKQHADSRSHMHCTVSTRSILQVIKTFSYHFYIFIHFSMFKVKSSYLNHSCFKHLMSYLITHGASWKYRHIRTFHHIHSFKGKFKHSDSQSKK